MPEINDARFKLTPYINVHFDPYFCHLLQEIHIFIGKRHHHQHHCHILLLGIPFSIYTLFYVHSYNIVIFHCSS